MIADRRHLLRLAGACALLPVIMSRPARAIAAGRFIPPADPMRYTRRLERKLADGAVLTVSRSFAIRFLPIGSGYRVEGEQVSVGVDAPAKLEAFAAIERSRRELGLFPLLLDRRGLIHGARQPVETSALDAAVREALSQIRAGSASTGERAELDRFVNAVHQSASKLVTELPQDLFAPTAPSRATTRDVALPDGLTGAVTVNFVAVSDPLTGLMTQATREVLTALSDDRRRTVETWHLAPL